MIVTDEFLYERWAEATRRAGQPQILYPQAATLREFAREIWREGYDDKVTAGPRKMAECPY